MDFFLAKRLPAGMESANRFRAACSRNCTSLADHLSTIRVHERNSEKKFISFSFA